MLLNVAEPFDSYIKSFELTENKTDIYIYSISAFGEFNTSLKPFTDYKQYNIAADAEHLDRAAMFAIYHAYENGYDKIILLRDEVKFNISGSDIEDLYKLLDTYDILYMNPHERNDCRMLNRKAIEYIATYKVDISKNSWKLIIDNRVRKRLSIGAVKTDILKHTTKKENMETYASSIIQTTKESTAQSYADYNNITLPSAKEKEAAMSPKPVETYSSMFNITKEKPVAQTPAVAPKRKKDIVTLTDSELETKVKNLKRTMKYSNYNGYVQKYGKQRQMLASDECHIEYPTGFRNSRCVIMVPIYKQSGLKYYEMESIKQTVAVFGNKYNICLVCPDCLNLDIYRKITNGYNFSVLRVDLTWFIDMFSYSRLCEETAFYKKFSDYEYMLICQTDAWATEDRIEEFIAYGYDYYGARCYNRKSTHYNGGFSLRNVKKMIYVTEHSKNTTTQVEDLYFSTKVPALKVCKDVSICDKFAVQSTFNYNKGVKVFGYHYIQTLPNFKNVVMNKTRKEIKLSAGPKVAVCAIAKLENHYIREWVEYYKTLGVDNIILYDNNDRSGESFTDVINDYIKDGFVIVNDVRGQKTFQMKAYQDCWNRYSAGYDWIAYFDCDEFLSLKKDYSIKDYLSRSEFDGVDSISINWLSYDDNGLTGFEDINDYNVLDRFKEPKADNDELPKDFGKHITEHKYNNHSFKRIVRCGKPIKVTHCHIVSEDLHDNVDNTGQPFVLWGTKDVQEKSFSKDINYDLACIKHYPTKTVKEYVETKYARRSAYANASDSVYKNIFYGFNKKHTVLSDALFNKDTVRILIVNYNTPKLVEACIKSVNKHMKDVLIYVFDNSDKEKFVNTFENVVVLDNTEGEIIDFDKMRKYWWMFGKTDESTKNLGSACHAYTIDKCMDLIGSDFILLDSDTVVKKDLRPMIDKTAVFTGEVNVYLKGWDKRVYPFCCYINAPLCKRNGIKYFDKKHMHGINIDKRNRCDTGGAFWLNAQKYKYNIIKCEDYVNHMGAGSHRAKATMNEDRFIRQNRIYWE